MLKYLRKEIERMMANLSNTKIMEPLELLDSKGYHLNTLWKEYDCSDSDQEPTNERDEVDLLKRGGYESNVDPKDYLEM